MYRYFIIQRWHFEQKLLKHGRITHLILNTFTTEKDTFIGRFNGSAVLPHNKPGTYTDKRYVRREFV